MAARRSKLLLPIVAVSVGLILASLVIGAGVYLQKVGERRAFQAATAGPPCQAVAAAPAFVHVSELKTLSFGSVDFRYVRGDADCQVTRPGRFGENAERPYCLFDHPGYVEATSGAHHAAYVVPVGQASLMAEPGGLRCALQASP